MFASAEPDLRPVFTYLQMNRIFVDQEEFHTVVVENRTREHVSLYLRMSTGHSGKLTIDLRFLSRFESDQIIDYLRVHDFVGLIGQGDQHIAGFFLE